MGAHDGLWLHHDPKVVCGQIGDDYNNTTIPGGHYAFVTINDPFSFSAWRIWCYIAEWIRDNDVNIRPIILGGSNVPYFVKFHPEGGSEYMSVYVPINMQQR